MSASRAAWREPMVWLLLAIPAATVVGGMATLRLARAGGIDAAPEVVRRTLQAQVTDLAPDAEAARRRLAATLLIDAAGQPHVALAAQADTAALVLHFVHPTRADLDRRWERAASAHAWHGPVARADARGRWILEDAAREWRLVGVTGDDPRRVVLEPAVAAR
jgi:hypothetical protein